MKCAFEVLAPCLTAANCTAPACSDDDGGSDSGGGGNDSGGGGNDSGGGGSVNCGVLDFCCKRLPDPAKSTCGEIVDGRDDVHCGNSKSRFCDLDPAACTKLGDCCNTLNGTEKTTCELQLSTYDRRAVRHCAEVVPDLPLTHYVGHRVSAGNGGLISRPRAMTHFRATRGGVRSVGGSPT